MRKNFERLQKIKSHANLIRAALESNQLDLVGEIMHETWQEKKRLSSEISNSEIEAMYQKARNAGALGGKICGAGAGGFLLLYIQREEQNKVREALKDYREFPFFLERFGSKIIFNNRSYLWK
jgi:D-glycero-alpha-D-manno-heptose-7-phosphate kinase